MSEEKYSGSYIKAMCTMIARGDISDIDTFKKYIQYADLDTPISAINCELDMLLGVDIQNINPKYYISDFGSEKKYAPIDLILYSCVCNKTYYTYKKELLKEIIKLDFIDFSNICKTLEYSVSKGDLELFNTLVSLNPNFNIKYSALRTGEPLSILNNCLSLAMCRLTINEEHVSKYYPRDIFNYLTSLNNVDFSLLKGTEVILEVLLNIKDIDDNVDIFKKVKDTVTNYKKI